MLPIGFVTSDSVTNYGFMWDPGYLCAQYQALCWLSPNLTEGIPDVYSTASISVLHELVCTCFAVFICLSISTMLEVIYPAAGAYFVQEQECS